MPTPFLREQLWFLLKFSLITVVLLTLSRILLVFVYADRLVDATYVYAIFWGGLRIDVSLLAQIIALPSLLLLLNFLLGFKGKFVHRFIRIWCWLFFTVIALMEAATPSFINEYDTRPNRLFIEYLNSPAEVGGMLLKGYWIQLIVVIAIVGWLAYWSFRWVKSKQQHPSRFSPMAAVAMVLVMMLLTLLIRSGLQHRPINPAMVAFSNDSMINSLPLNSTYSLMYAIYQMGNEASASKLYGSIKEEEMLKIIRQNMQKNVEFVSQELPTLHVNLPTGQKQNLNLIVVVEESLGAQFVGSLGGKPLTPSIDSYRDKSWFFTNLYATGTRSARGLEAITTGFLPSPARAVLKLPKAQKNFYTIAETLANEGYQNTFIYGGESHFDNMKGFFLANGFHRSIDQNDYLNPEFVGNWGVSDGDLFDRAYQEITTATDQPQFTLIFTSSNHTPFEFPDNKIELFDKEKNTVNNAVKYADYALGEFLGKLESGGFFENSIVMVVADHDARVMGEALVPVNRFHIPGFILGQGVKHQVDDTLVSQIDLAPTLLSLLGVDAPTPMLGQDLTQLSADYHGRAIMQYADKQAYLSDNKVVILQPEKKPVMYPYTDGKIEYNEPLIPDNKALAFAQFASWAYDQQKYRLD